MGSKYDLGSIVYPRIRYIMTVNDMSIRGLASKTGMIHTTLMRKLNGKSRFYYEEAEKIADALNLSRNEIPWMMLRS